MRDIELHIRKKDWASIILIGVFLSLFFSIFIYFLVELNLFDGAIFGLILGVAITLLAMIFISILNTHILPDIAKKYWYTLAILFSFLSGFCGTSISLVISVLLDIQMISKVEEHPLLFSTLLGILTYFVGAFSYAMVKMANIKEENEKKLIQSRLKSLELQLNPHFLYNSLNSLSELIHQDVNKSEKAILKLSSFLRSTMAEKAILSVGEELKNVRDYIELENIRFEDKISLTVNCENRFKEKQIPKFSIQLIVENAIKHGLEKDKLKISIDVKQEKELQILISNDGKEIEDKSFGIGLKNLKERLKILSNGSVKIVKTDIPTYMISIGKSDENISHR